MSIIDFFRIRPKKRKVKINSKPKVIFSNPTGYKKVIFYSGNAILISSFFYLTYLYWPLGSAIVKYKTANNETKNLITKPITKEEIPITNEFDLQIPKILASSKIIKDVSPFDKNEYLKVLEGNVVAHAKNSSLPGSGNGNTIFIFAHSTQQNINLARKNAVFYLLGELSYDDLIFVNYNGKIYKYKTYMKRVVSPSQVEYLNFVDQNNEILILQTCWPIGTNWKRLLVFSQKI